tara:strand:- start:290 stop:700 length:411 start_codon:yes stop_codon:yes gene_type:complete
MSWSAIAAAVGGAAKETMSNAAGKYGTHQESAASEEHAAQRELEAKMKSDKADADAADARAKRLEEELAPTLGNTAKSFEGVDFTAGKIPEPIFNLLDTIRSNAENNAAINRLRDTGSLERQGVPNTQNYLGGAQG